jgi:hypothetical protein
VTCGASAPHPSSSTGPDDGAARALAPRGLKPEPPLPEIVGVKTGLEEMGGGGPSDFGIELAPEYFEPEASATFCTIASGVRSRSDLAVI